ncbi:MAG: TetR/AcrR family transcriptional regulator [Opitutales bacterium]
MARRKDHTREELTRLAIDAGRQLVVEQGPAALTARRVAEAIGYTPGTLYNLFDNIDDLAAAINIGSMATFAGTLEGIASDNPDAESRLRRISQAYLDFHRDSPQLWSLLFAVPVNHHSEAYQQAIHRIFDQVIEALRPLSANADIARRKAKVLWSTLHGICLLNQSGKLNVREDDPPEALVATFLEQFLRTVY